jgi:murein L,D-transpeptidase YafK
VSWRAERSGRGGSGTRVQAGLCFLAFLIFGTASGHALRIDLRDVASDRIERQRAEAAGQLPLRGTPDIASRPARLAARGLTEGAPVMLRVFKAESELELWMMRDERYELFATYPICNWSGSLGPKIAEGDKQSPEGVYTLSRRQLHMVGRHPRSLNLGFPNTLDRSLKRTGSYILIHGGCGTAGCFSMTNPVMSEIFGLVRASLRQGQRFVHVHVFPFRMTESRLAAHAASPWAPFWHDLKQVYDSFDRTRLAPRMSVCEGRYMVGDAVSARDGAGQLPRASCDPAAEPLVAAAPRPLRVRVAADVRPQRAALAMSSKRRLPAPSALGGPRPKPSAIAPARKAKSLGARKAIVSIRRSVTVPEPVYDRTPEREM